MKRALILFSMMILCALSGANDLMAQAINITGKVVDSEGAPVSQVQVSLMIAGIETETDATGRFTLYQDNTGIVDPVSVPNKSYFDGMGLYIDCDNDKVNITVLDFSGREVATLLSMQSLTGSYVLYPGAYVNSRHSSMFLVQCVVGDEATAYKFFSDIGSVEEKGLFEAGDHMGYKKSLSANLSTLDTLVIAHNKFVGKKIPVDCYVCSFGDISMFEKVPEAPTNLTGSSTSFSAVTINWVDNSDNETGFRIERATYQVFEWTDFSELDIVSPNITEYSDEGLIQKSSYKYRVCAFNSGGNSPYTEEITVTTEVANPLSISGPSSSTGVFDINVTYSWPGMFGSTSDRFELEESTSPTDGFTKIDQSPMGQRLPSYTFSLSKPSGTYYYRARAYNTSYYTDYTNVISVSVNTPVQKAYLKVVNNTHYPMIDIRLNNQQLVGQGDGILPGGDYTFEFNSSGNVNYVLGVGYWDGSYRNVWFLLSGNAFVTVGTTSTLTFNNPTIGQLLSGFSAYRDWTGEYWDSNLNMHLATFRFFSNGSWTLYDDGVQIDSGTVSLVSWEDNAIFVNFKVCGDCETIQLPYPFGQFMYSNGPPSFPIITYTAQ